MKSQASSAAIFLIKLIEASDCPLPQPEYRFDPSRRWRFDLCWPEFHLAAEIEGGTWVKGRHTRPQGYENDCEKYNSAVLQGWRVLRFTMEMVKDGRALATVERAVNEFSMSSSKHTFER